MNKAQIILVRHGEDEDNANAILNGHRDNPLTEKGKLQARETGQRLKNQQIDIIYSSPLKRAYDTAVIIAKELKTGLKVNVHPKLIERNFGILTGKPLLDIPLYSNDLLITKEVTYFLSAEGAEDFPTVLKRAKEFVDELNTKHPGQTILVVTHGDAGRTIRAAYYGWDWRKSLKISPFHNADFIVLQPNA
ncbi:histidine phosphatase family protein [Patescibacteria group bacterium]|nr:histidine phosphatase family protein [Patescibacteria group bacterium]MBU1868317.1 histidine phosphatase family protein [Patescibacteria group bacterium]